MSFIPELSVIAAYSVAAAILTLTPGPDMALFLSKTISGGRPAGFATIFGTAVGLFVHACLAAAGLSALLAASATAFALLKIVGVGYLLYLAYDAIRNGSGIRLETSAAPAEPLSRVFAKGVLVNVLNPKIVLFFLTFLPQFVHVGEAGASGQLFFLGLWYIVISTPIAGAMVLGAAALARLFQRNPQALRFVDYAMAAVMAAFAVRLARSAV